MPFPQEGGSVESNLVGSRVGSALPAARLIVDPDKILELKRGIEEERDRVREWLASNRLRLHVVPRPGTDPCSEDTAGALAENGEAAVEAADGYVAELKKVAEALGDIAKAYGLTEDENARKFPWGTR